MKKALYFVSAVLAVSSTIGVILLIRLAMMSDKLLSGLCIAMAFIIGSIAAYHTIDVCRLRDKEREWEKLLARMNFLDGEHIKKSIIIEQLSRFVKREK